MVDSGALEDGIRRMAEGGEVLVVISKLKNYIKEASGGMNTSSNVAPLVSDRIRQMCDRAIENAKKDGRKTLMDRDFGDE